MNSINLTNDGTSEISFLHDFYDEVSDCILDFGINLETFRETRSLEWLEAHPEVDYIEDLIHRLDGIVLKERYLNEFNYHAAIDKIERPSQH